MDILYFLPHQRLKSFTAKKIINFLQQKNIKTILEQLAFYKKSHKNQTHYQLWQEGCHPNTFHNQVDAVVRLYLIFI
jgi:uncharacterized protein YpiB (UPF0302 family)